MHLMLEALVPKALNDGGARAGAKIGLTYMVADSTTS